MIANEVNIFSTIEQTTNATQGNWGKEYTKEYCISLVGSVGFITVLADSAEITMPVNHKPFLAGDTWIDSTNMKPTLTKGQYWFQITTK